MYLLAIIFPPLAVFFKKGFGSAVLNLFLWMLGFFPGIIHALFVVSNSNADNRSKKLEDVMKQTAVLNMQTMKAQQVSGQAGNSLNEIERLAELKKEGHLTQEEFDIKKKQLLG